MSEEELLLVKQAAQNKPQFEAVRRFLLLPLEPESWLPQLDLDKNDFEYGQVAKVAVKARNALVARFEEMERMIEEKKPKESINEAR